MNNKKFGRLSVLGEPFKKNGRIHVFAICQCGIKKEYRLGHLKYGATTSCGCYRKECTIKRATTHGLSDKHPLYSIWLNIKNRCYNKNVPAYKDYGGRGIQMDLKWRKDFKLFFDWCINNGWDAKLEIDRENNNDGYFPHNCRFITQTENARNRRNSFRWPQIHKIRAMYKTGNYTQAEIGAVFGVGSTTICAIVNNKHWKVDEKTK